MLRKCLNVITSCNQELKHCILTNLCMLAVYIKYIELHAIERLISFSDVFHRLKAKGACLACYFFFETCKIARALSTAVR